MIFPKPFAVDILDSGTLGRALVRTESLVAQSAGFGFQIDDDLSGAYLSVEPDADDTVSDRLNFTGKSFTFTGAGVATVVKDFVVRIGFNTNSGGAAVDTARPKIAIEFEQDYFSNYTDAGRLSDIRAAEWHLAFKRPGVDEQRPITFFGQWNVATAATPTTNNLKFLVQQLHHRTAANDVDFWSCDSTDGFKIFNWPLSVNITTTTKVPLSLSVPTSHNANVFNINYNAATFAYMTKYGELVIDSSATQSGTSGAAGASLYVRGRADSTYNFYVLASDGNARIRVNQSTGATGVIVFNSQFQNYGQFDQYNAAGNTLNFQVGPTGTLRSNQWTAASALGALNGVIPITDNASGAVKYVATYASFTP